jgi:Fic family protein
MTSTHQNQPTIPRLQIDLDEILGAIALELARVQICGQCQASVPSLINDLAHLVAEITRLSAELRQTRLDRANLRAAMRATLAALAEGEPDPTWYLRDELDGPESAADASRGPR